MSVKIRDLIYQHPGSGYPISVPKFEIEDGESVAITGPSGCGKTTFLNLISGLIKPGKGDIRVGGTVVDTLNSVEALTFRSGAIGYVFQDFGLLDYMSSLDNILYPYRICANRKVTSELRQKAVALANELGVSDQRNRSSKDLSHGERQRIAICRAVLGDPKLILADEPTGNLDPETKLRIMDVLLSRQRSLNATLIVVTHDHELLSLFDRVVDFSELTGGTG